MSLNSLAYSSLSFHAKRHVVLVFAVMVAASVITGSLIVGDSIRASLRNLALSRLGEVQWIVQGMEVNPRSDSAARLEAALKTPVVGVLQTEGLVKTPTGEKLVHKVQILGVKPDFFKLKQGSSVTPPKAGQALLNARLAEALAVKVGDEVLLRFAQSSALPRDVPIASTEGSSAALTVQVAGIVGRDQFGQFSLQAQQVGVFNIFVDQQQLAAALDLKGRVNLLAIARSPSLTDAAVEAAVNEQLDAGDLGFRVENVKSTGGHQIVHDSVFLNPVIERRRRSIHKDSERLLGYFVNDIQAGERKTPYSIVTGLEADRLEKLAGQKLTDSEVVIGDWLANDLKVKIGDSLKLKYFIVSNQRRLIEEQAEFKIAAIVPMAKIDKSWMPKFPGMSDRDHCRDWDSSLPIKLNRIRDVDESYWTAYKGTPKLLLTLSAAQELWANRFGNLTALRVPPGPSADELLKSLTKASKPTDLGLQVLPVRAEALKAASSGVDFGMLFASLGFFLIVSAMILAALVFSLGLEARMSEWGTLKALGLTRAEVTRVALIEGCCLSLLGSFLGAGAGVGTAQAVLHALKNPWQGAVNTQSLTIAVEPLTVFIGLAVTYLLSMATVAWTIRSLLKHDARALLTGLSELEAERLTAPRSGRPWMVAAGLSFALSLVCGLLAKATGQWVLFFILSGTLLLAAGLLWVRARLMVGETPRFHWASFAHAASTRRPGRSLAVVMMLAIGLFMVLAVGSHRKNARLDAHDRSSGTGGFALLGEASLPIVYDLNSAEGREFFGLEDDDMAGVEVVGFRVLEGQDASCLNLNRVPRPSLLGVDVEVLAKKGAFSVGSVESGREASWRTLKSLTKEGEIPAFADMNTILWALGKSLGGVLEYPGPDGETRKVRLVGALGSTVLQGRLIVSASLLEQQFPRVSGQKVFLVDAPAARASKVDDLLTQSLQDFGVNFIPSSERLADFQQVENTYLSIFLVLGAFAMVLGTVGLGTLVIRNVQERRAEMATLRALGYQRSEVRALIFREHAQLLGYGLGLGVGSALLAIAPSLPKQGFPLTAVLSVTVIIGLSAYLCLALATKMALSEDVLTALSQDSL